MKGLDRKKSIVLYLLSAVLAVYGPPVAATAQTVSDIGIVENPSLKVGAQMPGTIERAGTCFAVTDSKYLNVTLESSEPVNLVLESVPEMVVMDLEAAKGVASTRIKLSGFLPSTTYYKYEDDFHNAVTFATDADGSYTYAQDLTQPHLVFIQPRPSTKFIPSDTSIGTWDPGTRTYTLSTDVYETMQIDEDNLTLDGAGYTVTGAGSSYGVYLFKRTGVTVRNLNVDGFSYGIYLYNSTGSAVTDNTASWNKRYGICLYNSSSNTLVGNVVSNNHEGIFLRSSNGNSLTANTASDNYSGIYLYYDCNDNTLTGNTASNNSHGIYLYDSSSNTLTGNTTNSNDYYGIYLYDNCNNNTMANNTSSWNHSCGIYLYNSSENTLTGNTASRNYPGVYFYYNCNNNTLTGNTVSNNYYGVYLYYNCNNNEIYNNNFINNQTQAYTYSSSGNLFNLPAPIGGNYWSGWTVPNVDGDTFVDNPYVFSSGQDDLPWVRQDAWDNQPPTADAGADKMAHPRDVVTLDGSSSSDPEDDYPLTYLWQLTSKPEGSTAVLSDANTVSPTFTVDILGDYIIELVVTDSLGAQSTADQVLIGTYNTAPIADAGADQIVHPRDTVTLDGGGSSDPEEDYPLIYFWQIISKPEGSTAVLSDANTVSPTFTVDMLGDYIIELVVTDSLGAQSTADQVLIGTYNTTPVADAGADQTVIVLGTAVQLDANQSHDVDGDEITYFWTITQKPAGSLAELSDPCSTTPTFVADIHGDYVITLIVTDVFGSVSEPDSVTVSFENIKPIANAGENQSAVVGDTISLDGSGSTDGNGDLLTYSWTLTSKPEGSLAELSNPTSVQTSFVVDEPGTYVVSLVVNDGFVDSDPANATITAITYQEAAARVLVEAIVVVRSLPPEILKNGNITKDSIINKIEVVLDMIGNKRYETAVGKLINDVMEHADGCANSGEPDSNDWILTCEGQSQVYPLIMEAIQLLQNLI